MNIKYYSYIEAKEQRQNIEYEVYDLFMEVILEDGFFKQLDFNGFNRILFLNGAFFNKSDAGGVFVINVNERSS